MSYEKLKKKIEKIESNELTFSDAEKRLDNLEEANKTIKELEADLIKKPSKKRIAVNVAIWLPITLALSYLLFLMGEPRTVWMYDLIGIK